MTFRLQRIVQDLFHDMYRAHFVQSNLRLLGLCWIGIGAIFLFDLTTPLGITDHALYIFPLWAIYRLTSRPSLHIPIATGCCILLTITGFLLSPGGAPVRVGLTNRILGIIVLWILAVLLTRAGKEREELRVTQRQLEASEAKFRAVAETGSDILFTVDASGSTDYVNPRFYLYTGLSAETPAHEWLRAVHPDDIGGLTKCISHSLQNGHQWMQEFRLRGKDQRYRWFRATCLPQTNAERDTARWFGTVSDIHDLKTAETLVRELLQEAKEREAELRKRQEQLIQAGKLASIGELATGIAHELNNPLNNINLFVGNLSDLGREASVLPADQVRTTCQLIQQQINRAATIINHLRTFARTAANERQLVSLNDAIRGALKFVSEPLRLHQVDVQLDLCPSNPLVSGNRIQLEQVFLNLLTNAIDAMMQSAEKRLCIACRVQDGQAHVLVQDTGIGIAPDVRGRVFDPFFTTKEVGKGTGLGLSISYGIIQDHHGTISVDSRPGIGASFHITLPLTQAPDQSFIAKTLDESR